MKGEYLIKATTPVKLDLTDKKIITYLLENSRLSYSYLAKALRISPQRAKYKVERLIKNKILTEFHAYINILNLGYKVYLVLIESDSLLTEDQLKELYENESIMGLITTADRFNYFIFFAAKEYQDFLKMLNLLNTTFLIKNFEVLEFKRYYQLNPNWLNISIKKIKIQKEDISFIKALEKYWQHESSLSKINIEKIDSKDVEILNLLTDNARMSINEISQKIKISRDAVVYRIKKLIANGILLGFSCYYQPNSLISMPVCCFINILDEEEKNILIKYLDNYPYTNGVYEAQGSFNLVLPMAFPNWGEIKKFLFYLNSKKSVLSYKMIFTLDQLFFRWYPRKVYNDLINSP